MVRAGGARSRPGRDDDLLVGLVGHVVGGDLNCRILLTERVGETQRVVTALSAIERVVKDELGIIFR
ncbi:hypothetical protein L861_14030 [Litchfieldella anticariensis FP35 = DSM 16096]|uniref:Uncharacterized protein n=1 Tax=Litchfieldella anticariensis (strain DSM 16096 / CECT 5854 / CIP 108499 / LMG 22089 / FP35) TaxID=1121939 RepID=S2KJ85_LITA3|nr:hypothetical protein L861_14030 [Halomonas anticariensis FP35 = DSM 16096]